MMGHQIIKEPSGKFCIFSTATDSIIIYDATAEELIEHYTKEACECEAKRVAAKIKAVDNGDERAYGQFTMTYEEAVRWHEHSTGQYFPRNSGAIE
jgi:hypothetical protein